MFERSIAIAMKTGPLEQAIRAWKGDRSRYGWGLIFSRVLLGYLQENWAAFAEFDAIIPSPTFVYSEGTLRDDHTAFVVREAAKEDTTGLPFVLDPPLIVKIRSTPRMRYTTSVMQRRVVAAGELRAALHVPNPSAVSGRRILVYDDVFTTGSTLNEVARALREAGAREVSQIVLARQPWTTSG